MATILGLGAALAASLAAPSIAGAAAATDAPAASRRTVLTYAVDASGALCPGEAELKRLVMMQLGRDPFDADGAVLPAPSERVAVRITPGVRGLEATVVWTDERGRWRGERSIAPSPAALESRDCSALLRGVAFAIAVQLQPEAGDSAVPAEANPGAEDARPVTSPPAIAQGVAAAPAPPPSDTTIARSHWLLAAGPAVAFGLTPDPNVQGRLTLTLLIPRLSFELGLQGALPSNHRPLETAGFRARLWLVSAATCAGTDGLAVCALAKLGQLTVRGLGVDAPATASGLLAQTGLGLVVRRPLGSRFYAVGTAEVLVSLDRWTILLNDAGVWTTPRVAAAAAVALGSRFR